MSIKERVVEKLTSGKFLLTVLVGYAFVYAVINKILSAEAISSIIVMVFMAYFNKDKKADNNGG